jgi:predicted class III extradiol MEMO1 family dioxygenase
MGYIAAFMKLEIQQKFQNDEYLQDSIHHSLEVQAPFVLLNFNTKYTVLTVHFPVVN